MRTQTIDPFFTGKAIVIPSVKYFAGLICVTLAVTMER